MSTLESFLQCFGCKLFLSVNEGREPMIMSCCNSILCRQCATSIIQCPFCRRVEGHRCFMEDKTVSEFIAALHTMNVKFEINELQRDIVRSLQKCIGSLTASTTSLSRLGQVTIPKDINSAVMDIFECGICFEPFRDNCYEKPVMYLCCGKRSCMACSQKQDQCSYCRKPKPEYKTTIYRSLLILMDLLQKAGVNFTRVNDTAPAVTDTQQTRLQSPVPVTNNNINNNITANDNNNSDNEDYDADCHMPRHVTTIPVARAISSVNLSQSNTLSTGTLALGKETLKSKCQLIANTKNPEIYKIPFHVVSQNLTIRYRKCIIGSQSQLPNSTEKIFLLVGSSGSGKTTLINGMVNYIYGIQRTDPYRFRLIDSTDEEEGQTNDQTKSQTSWISSYTIPYYTDSPVPYTTTIIDTPGFGDTVGITRDKAIIDQMRSFFTDSSNANRIDQIDAVSLVVKSTEFRLTPAQKYIFDSVLSIFGKDMADNIFAMITFVDAGKPQVLDALKSDKIPYCNFFKFNSSAIYAPIHSEETGFIELFWKAGTENYRNFFIESSKLQSRSLILTKDVLEQRKIIEATIQGLQAQMKQALMHLHKIDQEKQILKRYEAEIETNKNFKYNIDVPKIKKEPLKPNTYVTNCLVCNSTCHFPCQIPNDAGKHSCWAMTDNYCRICQLKCFWENHVNNNFRFETYFVTEVREFDELRDNYNTAVAGKHNKEKILKNVNAEIISLKQAVLLLIADIRRSINRLDNIALRQNPLSTVNYIDILIINEENEQKQGYLARINQLKEIRSQAELQDQIKENKFQFLNLSQ